MLYIFLNYNLCQVNILSRSPIIFFLYSHYRSLEYDPRYYGLYFHDDTELPLDSQMWTYLDSHYQG